MSLGYTHTDVRNFNINLVNNRHHISTLVSSRQSLCTYAAPLDGFDEFFYITSKNFLRSCQHPNYNEARRMIYEDGFILIVNINNLNREVMQKIGLRNTTIELLIRSASGAASANISADDFRFVEDIVVHSMCYWNAIAMFYILSQKFSHITYYTFNGEVHKYATDKIIYNYKVPTKKNLEENLIKNNRFDRLCFGEDYEQIKNIYDTDPIQLAININYVNDKLLIYLGLDFLTIELLLLIRDKDVFPQLEAIKYVDNIVIHTLVIHNRVQILDSLCTKFKSIKYKIKRVNNLDVIREYSIQKPSGPNQHIIYN